MLQQPNQKKKSNAEDKHSKTLERSVIKDPIMATSLQSKQVLRVFSRALFDNKSHAKDFRSFTFQRLSLD